MLEIHEYANNTCAITTLAWMKLPSTKSIIKQKRWNEQTKTTQCNITTTMMVVEFIWMPHTDKHTNTQKHFVERKMKMFHVLGLTVGIKILFPGDTVP